MSCSKEKQEDNGVVSGIATDSQGTPLVGVRIIVDNSVLFNANLTATTDGAGKYSVKIPTGSWYAFALYEKTYHGKKYNFYLHPDSDVGFGGEGAVRNFKWQLTGEKAYPLSGYYGGLVTIDNHPEFNVNAEDIEFTFTPQGELIDGSNGTTFIAKALDGHQLKDLPMGRYRVTARYNANPLTLRRWNTDNAFETSLVLDFEPRIDGQCDNCFKIEYNR